MANLALLEKLPGISGLGASSVAEAKQLIAQSPPQVVILDLQLPDGTGLDVLTALAAYQAWAVLIVVSGYLDANSRGAQRSPRIHGLGKPTPIRELQRIVMSTQGAAESVGGYSVLDYVQLCIMGSYSATIECAHPNGPGKLVLEKGQPYSAQDAQGPGVDALLRLLAPMTRPVRVVRHGKCEGPRNLMGSWEQLTLGTRGLPDQERASSKKS